MPSLLLRLSLFALYQVALNLRCSLLCLKDFLDLGWIALDNAYAFQLPLLFVQLPEYFSLLSCLLSCFC